MARTKEFDEEVVLNKAVDLFWYKGFNGTSAQDLVDELGISRSSLYDTFGDKHAIFIKSLQRYCKKLAGSMVAFIDQSENVEATIKHIFKVASAEAVEDQLAKGCFMVNTIIELAPHDKDVAAIVKQYIQDIENALCRAIEKGQDQGVFSKRQTAQSLARFLFNNLSGIRVASKSGTDAKVYDDVVGVALSVLSL